MTDEPVRVPEKVSTLHFTEEEVDTCLLTIAKAGSYERAQKQLALVGIKVNMNTLRAWKRDRYPIRYAEILERHRQDLEGIVVARTMDGFIKQAAIEERITERLEDNIDKIDVRDLSQTLRNVNAAKGQNLDKYLLATGRPTAHVMTRSVDENLMILKSVGLVEGDTIDGEADDE